MKLDLKRLILAGCGILLLLPNLRAGQISVFAAASLSDSLKQIASVYERATGERVVFNLGASSTLARQIEEGAPADVFFSADEAKMDALQARGLIVRATRKSRLSNALVIVLPADSQLEFKSPRDLANPAIKRLALADPEAVPAGIYARRFLEKENLWTAVKRKVVPTQNVRAALAAVESGDVEAGIVYRTDAAITQKVKVAYQVSATEGPPISYPVAVVKGSLNRANAEKFVSFLNSPQAGKVFQDRGFIVLK